MLITVRPMNVDAIIRGDLIRYLSDDWVVDAAYHGSGGCTLDLRRLSGDRLPRLLRTNWQPGTTIDTLVSKQEES